MSIKNPKYKSPAPNNRSRLPNIGGGHGSKINGQSDRSVLSGVNSEKILNILGENPREGKSNIQGLSI